MKQILTAYKFNMTENKKERGLIARVRRNAKHGQKVVTIPKTWPFEEGDYVLIKRIKEAVVE